MTAIITVGLPRMMKETGERRIFLPDFVRYLTDLGATVFLEEGYAEDGGYTFADYRKVTDAVHLCSREEAFRKELVLVLRSPEENEFSMLMPGNILMSMLHYPTRTHRVELLKSLGVNAISLDGIVNDQNVRLVENMKAVAWNGLEAAFDELEKRWPGLRRKNGGPFKVLILGTGMVGKHAADAATKLGRVERNNRHIAEGGPGAIALSVGRNITGSPETMRALMQQADILVDATQRRDPSQPVIPNAWIAWLPEHAIIVDLSVDPYLLDDVPPVVRGIEGIPQGNLDKYVFTPDDPAWETQIPAGIPCNNRRTTVSCYSWPGIYPEACMKHYATQLEPLMAVLLEKGYAGLSPDGSYFERALYRATLHGWLKQHEQIALPQQMRSYSEEAAAR